MGSIVTLYFSLYSFILDYYWTGCFASWTSQETTSMYSVISSSSFWLPSSWRIATNLSRGTDSKWQLDLLSNRIRRFHIRSRYHVGLWMIGLSSECICRSSLSSWRWSIWNWHSHRDQSTLYGLIKDSPRRIESIHNRTSSFEDWFVITNGFTMYSKIVFW